MIVIYRWLLPALLLFSLGLQADNRPVGGDFELMNQDGEPFQLTQLRGKVVMLFFGYTHCPDICPGELSHIAMVMNGLGDEATRIQGLFVTIDPERDRPEVLKNYLGFFNNRVVGLTGSEEEIRRIAERYRVRFGRHASSSLGYTMDHSANLFIIDQQGEIDTVIPYGFPPQHTLKIVENLLVKQLQ